MGLSIVFAGLKKSVSQFNAQYEAGRSRQPELRPYATTASLLDALKLSSPLSDEARDAIVLAIIAEQQRAAHPLWQSLLLAAFEPMLRRLSSRVGGGKSQKDENEQRVVMAFLEAVQEISLVHPPERAALYLKRATERAVWRARSDQRRDAEMAEFDEETAPCNPHAEPEAFAQCAKNEIATMLAAEGDGKELLEVVLATKSGSETLREYVERVHAHLDESGQQSVYVRLQRQRLRALARLTTRVRGLDAVMAEST